jgi:hypothetical protein
MASSLLDGIKEALKNDPEIKIIYPQYTTYTDWGNIAEARG